MPLHVHFSWGVSLIGKLLYWALLTPSWVNIFQVLEVHPEASISEYYHEKGKVVAINYFVIFGTECPVLLCK